MAHRRARRLAGFTASAIRPRGRTTEEPMTHQPPATPPGRRPARTQRTRGRQVRPVLAWSAAAIVTALAVGLVLFQPWRLLTRSAVDEPLPVATAAAAPLAPTPGPSGAAPASAAPGS